MLPFLIILAACAALSALVVVGNAFHFFRKHHLPRVAYRLLFKGIPADGVYRANAGWLRSATIALPANRWHPQARLPPWVRAPRARPLRPEAK